MNFFEAAEEYQKALKDGQKEFKLRQSRGENPYPEVLDELLGGFKTDSVIDVGLVDIPAESIIGVKSAGRIAAFSASFKPLLSVDTEFGSKWCNLCMAHMGDVGIQDPIECYEYLGNFYVQEGNKRVSVMRHFGAAEIPALVRRVMPVQDGSNRVKAYNEFLDFYKQTGIYSIQFTRPGSYAKLKTAIGLNSELQWDQDERRRFRAYYQYFTNALKAVAGEMPHPIPETALLLWLELYSFSELGDMSSAELRKSIAGLDGNIRSVYGNDPEVQTAHPENKGAFANFFKGRDHLKAAFVHQGSLETSLWTRSHEEGRKALDREIDGKPVITASYFGADDRESTDALIQQAVDEAADVVFTTAPPLMASSVRASLNYPKVRFFNCSVCQPYSSVTSYYTRVYEGKFLTGAIAGAICEDGRIGYTGAYPIYGAPASINAFALGAQMTNPEARIYLKWTSLPGNPAQDFLREGIRVISMRDAPAGVPLSAEYGICRVGDDSSLEPLLSPCWKWAPFYERIIRSILNGSWEDDRDDKAVNLWWGFASGTLDVLVSDKLPEGLRVLMDMILSGLKSGTLNPFARRVVDQEGTVRNEGPAPLSATELIRMDWLCENVIGAIPGYDDVIPISKPLVKLLGIYPTGEEEEPT